MRMHYYYIRVYDNDGKPLSTRCERAAGPRMACHQAFGTVYDNDYDTARYLDLGTRKPAYLTQKAINELTNNPANWKRIPKLVHRVKNVGPKVETHEQIDGCD